MKFQILQVAAFALLQAFAVHAHNDTAVGTNAIKKVSADAPYVTVDVEDLNDCLDRCDNGSTSDWHRCKTRCDRNFNRATPRPNWRPTRRPTRRPNRDGPTRRTTRRPNQDPTRRPTRRPNQDPTRRPTRRPNPDFTCFDDADDGGINAMMPVCHGNHPGEYCDGTGDCENHPDFCACAAGLAFCKTGVNPCPTRWPNQDPTRRPNPDPTRQPSGPFRQSCTQGMRDGQEQVRQSWRNNGQNCDDAWNLVNEANRMKDRNFPRTSGNWKTKSFNECARRGVDDEVSRIEKECLADDSRQCTDLGNAAAEHVVMINWCSLSRDGVKFKNDYKRECKEAAYDICEGNIPNVAGRWCPDENMSTNKLRELQDKCWRQVNKMVGSNDEFVFME